MPQATASAEIMVSKQEDLQAGVPIDTEVPILNQVSTENEEEESKSSEKAVELQYPENQTPQIVSPDQIFPQLSAPALQTQVGSSPRTLEVSDDALHHSQKALGVALAEVADSDSPAILHSPQMAEDSTATPALTNEP